MASIGRAYGTYYTHSGDKRRRQPKNLGRLKRVQRALTNGYLNNRYGTRYQPESKLGIVLVRFFPAYKEALDSSFRLLSKPLVGQRLLDIGCGNGEFLSRARDAGWEVVGVDPDHNAVQASEHLDLDVRKGSISVLSHEVASFDAITLSHVIEHVHDPFRLMLEVRSLLKPGGKLYIDTPDIQSLGAKLFGSNWRGIESPRHLVLFSASGLELLLQRCGFVDVKPRPRSFVTKRIFLSSYKISQGLSPYSTELRSLPFSLLLRAYFNMLFESQCEFITLAANKKSP